MDDLVRKIDEQLNYSMDVLYYPDIRYRMHIFIAVPWIYRPNFAKQYVITGKSLSEIEKRYYYRQLISLGDDIKHVSKRYKGYRSYQIAIIEI
jgi:hypothetical protein